MREPSETDSSYTTRRDSTTGGTPAARLEATTSRSLTERLVGQVGGGQRRQRDQAGRAGDIGDHEAMKVVDDRSGEQFSECSRIVVIRPVERLEIGVTLTLVDDRRREAQTDKDQVEYQSTGTTVAIDERMDPLERAVDFSQDQREAPEANRTTAHAAADLGHLRHPVDQESRDIRS